MMIGRRGFLLGLGAAVAAPAIVRAEGLMKVRGIIMPAPRPSFTSVLLDAAGKVIQVQPLNVRPCYDDCGLTHVDLSTIFPPSPKTGDVVTKWEVRDDAGNSILFGVTNFPLLMTTGLQVQMGLTVDRNLAVNMKMTEGGENVRC